MIRLPTVRIQTSDELRGLSTSIDRLKQKELFLCQVLEAQATQNSPFIDDILLELLHTQQIEIDTITSRGGLRPTATVQESLTLLFENKQYEVTFAELYACQRDDLSEVEALLKQRQGRPIATEQRRSETNIERKLNSVKQNRVLIDSLLQGHYPPEGAPKPATQAVRRRVPMVIAVPQKVKALQKTKPAVQSYYERRKQVSQQIQSRQDAVHKLDGKAHVQKAALDLLAGTSKKDAAHKPTQKPESKPSDGPAKETQLQIPLKSAEKFASLVKESTHKVHDAVEHKLADEPLNPKAPEPEKAHQDENQKHNAPHAVGSHHDSAKAHPKQPDEQPSEAKPATNKNDIVPQNEASHTQDNGKAAIPEKKDDNAQENDSADFSNPFDNVEEDAVDALKPLAGEFSTSGRHEQPREAAQRSPELNQLSLSRQQPYDAIEDVKGGLAALASLNAAPASEQAPKKQDDFDADFD